MLSKKQNKISKDYLRWHRVKFLNWVVISSEKNWRLQLNVSISMLWSFSRRMLDSGRFCCLSWLLEDRTKTGYWWISALKCAGGKLVGLGSLEWGREKSSLEGYLFFIFFVTYFCSGYPKCWIHNLLTSLHVHTCQLFSLPVPRWTLMT